MKAYLFCIALALVLFISGCKKDDPAPDPSTLRSDTLAYGWTKVIVDPEEDFYEIAFNSNNTGYVCGRKIHKSVDGGRTWTVIANIEGFNMSVTNNGSVFVAGLDACYRSTDGGTTFSQLPVYANEVFFADDMHGYFRYNSGLHHTTDGGNNWVQISIPVATFSLPGYIPFFQAIFFFDDNNGWIAAGNKVFRSMGSSSVWEAATISGQAPSGDFVAVARTPNNSVYAFNNTTQLYKSTDGGANFSMIKNFFNSENYSYTDMCFVDDNTGYVCIGNQILKTTDGGNSWNRVVLVAEGRLVEIHFTDANHGWACGNDGKVLIFNQ